MGITDSTLTFKEQQNARLALGTKVYAFPGEAEKMYLLNFRNAAFLSRWQSYPWLYALDFAFDRGSAANYSAAVRASYTSSWATEYQFKEMIGIWNGESRFVSDTRVKIATQADSRGDIILAKSPYEYAKELGAVDIGEATAGDFLTQNNNVPINTAPSDIINRNESANNTRVSASVGENLAHNNIPPSYGVYVWKRIA